MDTEKYIKSLLKRFPAIPPAEWVVLWFCRVSTLLPQESYRSLYGFINIVLVTRNTVISSSLHCLLLVLPYLRKQVKLVFWWQRGENGAGLSGGCKTVDLAL